MNGYLPVIWDGIYISTTATMIFVQPAHSVAWAVLLVVYVPVVLIVAALLKWAVITVRGRR